MRPPNGLPVSAEAGGDPPAALLVSTFYMKGALFALDTAEVEEVVRPRKTTRVAHSPEYVLGIMNLRGSIVTVLDLAQILRLGKTPASDDARLYIVSDGDGTAGLMVDRAAEVIELDAALLEAPPAGVCGAEGRFLRGIARTGGRLVAVLNATAVLATESV